MNIKFRLEPKVAPVNLPELAKIVKNMEDTKVEPKEIKTLQELLYGKEIELDELIASD
jgi:hypothetical protein